MSARDDAMLSAQERAALAGLEARAETDDPRLASHLRGQVSVPGRVRVTIPPGLWAWAAHVNLWLVGPVLAVLGLIGLLVGVAVSPVVGVLGAVAAAGGLVMLATAIERRLVASRATKLPDEG